MKASTEQLGRMRIAAIASNLTSYLIERLLSIVTLFSKNKIKPVLRGDGVAQIRDRPQQLTLDGSHFSQSGGQAG